MNEENNKRILSDDRLKGIIIAKRIDLHAKQNLEVIAYIKHVFLKTPCIES